MTSHDLLDGLITMAQILCCNSFLFQILFFSMLCMFPDGTDHVGAPCQRWQK